VIGADIAVGVGGNGKVDIGLGVEDDTGRRNRVDTDLSLDQWIQVLRPERTFQAAGAFVIDLFLFRYRRFGAPHQAQWR